MKIVIDNVGNLTGDFIEYTFFENSESGRLFRTVRSDASHLLPLLEVLCSRSWPDEYDLLWGTVVDRCVGEPVGHGNALRLRLDWISDNPGRSAIFADKDVKNLPSLGLDNYDKILSAIGEDYDDWFRILAPRHLDELAASTKG